MAEIQLRYKMPHSAPALFDLVADVERYPDFLPYFIDARVERRTSHAFRSIQTVGVLGLRFSYRSFAILRRPYRLVVQSNNIPFRRLRACWSFRQLPEECEVQLKVDYELYARWFESMIQPWIHSLSEHMVAAFADRARLLYI